MLLAAATTFHETLVPARAAMLCTVSPAALRVSGVDRGRHPGGGRAIRPEPGPAGRGRPTPAVPHPPSPKLLGGAVPPLRAGGGPAAVDLLERQLDGGPQRRALGRIVHGLVIEVTDP